MKYRLFDKPAYVLGFFSQYHKSIFTHHDSFVHMHLLTKDKTKMGHVDELKFNPKQVALFIAVE
jgi:acetolactate decarboxylase